MFWRLFGAYSALLAVTLGSLGWVLTNRIETHLLEEMRQGLEMKTALIRELVAGQTLDRNDWQARVQRLAREINTRITLLAEGGEVLADSAEDPRRMKTHDDRPEVLQAKTDGIGVATRFSATLHEPMMYVARRNDSGQVRYVRLALPLDGVGAEVRWLSNVVWTAAGLTMLMALCLSLILARRISAPLVELAEAARSIAQGQRGQRVRIASRDEIGILAGAFNDMSEACAEQVAQIERDGQQLRAIFRSMVEGVLVIDADLRVQFLNDAASRLFNLPLEGAQGRKLWQLIRHRQLGNAAEQVLASDKPHAGELEWTGAERKVLAVHGTRLPGLPSPGAVLVFHDVTPLRKLERLRQDFVANVSHELKTPLAAIQATVETLLDGAVSDPEHNVRFLERIGENADRLHRLVQDLLTLGRIESGQEIMNVQPTPVQAVIEGCMERHEQRAAAKELALEQSPPAEPVMALADEDALAEILDNLVDNAVKYTSSGGKVTLRWYANNGAAILEVADTGVGIPEKDLPRIFERFYRVDKARSRELGGTGLGLSIVKHLVQTLGGTVTASSRLGEGSTFTLRLPVPPAS
jgi:two-component system phosphate regulon sensor histidine kinase PhoR